MNKRNILLIISGVTIFVGIGAWYLFFKKSNLPKYIPLDSMMVLKIDPSSLASKLDKKALQSMSFYKKLSQKMDDEGIKVDQLLENPEETGMSLSDNIYCFSDMKGKKPCIGIVFAVADKNKLKGFLNNLTRNSSVKFKESNGNFMFVESERNDDYPSSNTAIVWNDDACIVYNSNEESDIEATNLLKLSKEASILSSDAFSSSEDKGGDISMYLNFKSLTSLIGKELDESNEDKLIFEKVKDNLENTDGASLVINLNQDNIDMEIFQFLNQGGNTSNLSILSESGIQEKYVDFISTNGDVLFGMSAVLNMENVFKLINTIPGYDKVKDEIEEEFGLTESEMKDLFDGTLTFAINEIKTKQKGTYDSDLKGSYNGYENSNDQGNYESNRLKRYTPIPIFSIQIGLNNPSAYQKILRKLKRETEDNLIFDDNLVIIPFEEQIGKICLVQLKDRLIITNDESSAKILKNNGKWSASINQECKTLFTENPISMYLNLDYKKYINSETEKVLDDSPSTKRELENFKKILENFKTLEMSGNNLSAKIKLNFTQSNTHVLMRIFGFMNDLYTELEKNKNKDFDAS
jgi:hypothetical protein